MGLVRLLHTFVPRSLATSITASFGVMAVGAFTLTPMTASAVDVPQSFTLDGKLFSDAAGTTPLVDSSIVFKVQILDQDQICVLYEEQQIVNTATSQGYFTVQVGSALGNPRRTVDDSGNTMAAVFQNITAVNGKLLSNGNACSAAATAGNRRFVRITIAPNSMGGTERVLAPNLTVDSVPNAVVAERAESIQGFRSTDLLKVNTAAGSALSQSNLESLFTSVTRFNALSSVVDGTSSNYVQSSAGGARLPVINGAPTGPTQGSIWYDTGDNRLKYYDGSAPVSLGTGGGSVTSVGFTAPAELIVAGAPITSSGTIAVTWAQQTTSRVFASPDGSTGVPTFRALVPADAPFAVVNSGGTPSLQSGLDGAKGAATTAGRIWIATDTRVIYRDTGAVWESLGGTGTVTSVSGTLPISVATGTSTPVISIATANTTTTGALSSGDWNIFNAKLTSPLTTKGDLLSRDGSAHVRLPVGSDGQVLVPDAAEASGLRWANFSVGNLKTAAGAAQFGDASCAATQTLTWSSLTNTFSCTAIAGLNASVITAGTIDDARLPAGATYWTAATGGINRATGNVGIGAANPGAMLQVGTEATSLGTMRLAGDTSGYVQIQPATAAGSWTMTLPVNDGDNGQVLTTNGSGVTSWTTVAVGGGGTVTEVTGTAPISVATGTTTPVVSIATANTTTTGAISSGDWNTFNAKLTSPLTTKGDLLSRDGSAHVRLPVGADGQVLVPDAAEASGLRWINFGVEDLKTAAGAAQFVSATCDATQTLTWSSLSNTFTCSNIAGLGAGVITTGVLPVARGGTGAATLDDAGIVDKTTAQTISGAKIFTNNVQVNAQNSLRLYDSTSTDYVGLRAPGTVTSSYTLNLPAAQGGASTVLVNDGGGNLSWSAPNGGSLSSLTAATATNTIDNLNFAQTWNFSTATTQSPMSIAANALTTGSILNLTTSSASINSTNGLLNVANSSATTTGTLARFQSNSTAGSGLTVLNSGNVGVGTDAPGALLQLGTAGASLGTFRVTGSTSGYVQIQPAAAAGSWTMTLPVNDGDNGQVLTTDGSGVTSWTTVATSGGTVTEVTGTLPISVATGTTTPVVSIATANTTTTGAISSGDWNTFNAKLTSPLTTKGDLLSRDGSAHVRLPVGSDGQVLIPDAAEASGLRWANFSVGNLKTAAGAAQFADANCDATETLTWSSLTNAFSCTAIAGLNASVITAGTIADARLPASATYWSAATGGINRASGNVGISSANPGALLQIGTEAASLGTMRLAGNTSGYVQIQPAAAAGSWTMTLPANDGDNGQVLTTNGSGVTSWASSGAATTIDGLTDAVSNNSTTFNMFLGAGVGGSTTGTDNTGLGADAINSLTTGSNNVAIGSQAAQYLTTGSGNVAIGGQETLRELTTGGANIALGPYSSSRNTAGSNNITLGYASAFNNEADDNIALGASALSENSGGSEIIAIGREAMRYANSAVGAHTPRNVAIGPYALTGSGTASANTGTRNTALGHTALNAMTSGSGNLGLGENSGSAITTGSNNVILGSNTGSTIATSSNNIILSDGAGNNRVQIDSSGNVGVRATAPGAMLQLGTAGTSLGTFRMTGNTSGYVQIQPAAAAGSWTMTLPVNDGDNGQVLTTNGSGVTSWVSAGAATTIDGLTDAVANYATNYNMYLGSAVGGTTTTGFQNTGLGSLALQNITESEGTVAIGNQALQYLTTGNNNVGIGREVMHQTSTGSSNIAIGQYALGSNTSGSENVAVGAGAMAFGAASENTAIGAGALGSGLTSGANVAAGRGAGSNVTGASYGNIFLGYLAGPDSSTTISDTLWIANYNGTPTIYGDLANQRIGIGTTTVSDKLHVFGDIRVGTTGTNGCLKGFGGATLTGTCSSDIRLKKDFKPMESIADKLSQVQPFYYKWRSDEFPERQYGNDEQLGVKAQEIQKIFPSLVVVDEDGFLQVKYSDFTMYLLKGFSEQHERVQNVERGIASIKEENAQLKEQVKQLQERLDSQAADIELIKQHLKNSSRQ